MLLIQKPSTTPRPHQVYECVHCSRPAFTGFVGQVEQKESLWVFESCFRLVVFSKCTNFEGHPIFWVKCRCGQEFGYFIPYYSPRAEPIWLNNYITRIRNIKARVDAGRILHWFQLLKQNQRPIVDDHCWLVEDVLFEEILPRLPVESLRRFRGVCKKWRHCITTDSHFISNHVRRSSRSTKMTIILVTSYPRHRMLFVDHRSNTTEVADVSRVLKKSAFVFCKLVGSCDGLVCLRLRRWVNRYAQHDEILLWNPETGRSRDAYVPPPHCIGETYQEYPVYGFGFDQSHNDYKVVKLRQEEGLGIKLSVFSMNMGCWRELEDGVPGCKLDYNSERCVLVCSRLYWVVIRANVSPHRLCVLWFDLNDDEIGIMDVLDLPCWHGSKFLIKWNSNSLALLELVKLDRKEIRFHFILHPTIAPEISFPRVSHFKSFGVSWGRFFMNETSGDISMYDVETGVDRPRVLLSTKTSCILDDVCNYLPSLVSVYPNIANTRQNT